ncbi:TPA: hypothetical protein ACFK3W_07835, partial [Neisseria gonorrhoeae]
MKRESDPLGFCNFKSIRKPESRHSRESGNLERIRTETRIPSFPRKWESRMSNLKKPFYPISSYADGP